MVTAVAFVMWYSAMSRLGADTAGLFAGLIPVSALASSVLIGHDQVTITKAIGVLLVGGGVVFGVNSVRRVDQTGALKSTNRKSSA